MMTKILTLILWCVFGIELYLSEGLSPSTNVLLSMGALQGASFSYEKLLYAGFLHAHFLHIFFNTWALSSIGSIVERYDGPIKMIFIFLCGVIGGSSLSLFFQTNPYVISVGASSGIMALLMNLFIIGIKQNNTWLLKQLLFTIIIALVPVIPGIDYSGHLGGAIVGIILGIAL
ncbi:MAG: rhomboid family intramembrane serine protease [Alphaproteobacteria bacterium]|nr:MAG: rhomboid family intramembrane serine protease [Alphaproteobacteria bacterium]